MRCTFLNYARGSLRRVPAPESVGCSTSFARKRRLERRRVGVLLVLLLALLVGACNAPASTSPSGDRPAPDGSSTARARDGDSEDATGARRGPLTASDSRPSLWAGGDRRLTLRGDPAFTPSQLSSAELVTYQRLMQEIADPENQRAIMRLAASDDLFKYGRTLHGYIQAVLTAFRVTGDLALLDHVDFITQRMRQELGYGWRNTKDRTDGTHGDYLMWVFRSDPEDSQFGKNRKIDAIKTSGLIAMVAYALELNRDLASPGGRDYGAHADFWRTYLIDHFEAEWRERYEVPTGFPIMHHPDGHTYWTWTKWHYFMGLLTGDPEYLGEARRMADVIWADIHNVDLPVGTAYVWTSNISQLADVRQYLMTTGYANSIYGDVVTFHLEGFHEWADEENVRAFARTLTEFVFDKDDPSMDGISSDVGGGVDQAGIPSEDTRRRTPSAFTQYQYALISPWDVTGEIARVSHDIQESSLTDDTTRLAAGLLLDAHVRRGDAAVATRRPSGAE